MTPQQAYEQVQIGFQAYSAGRIEEAESIADKVLTEAPRDPNGLYLKAMNRMAQGDMDGALVALNQAVEVQPDWSDLHIATGLCHLYSNRIEASKSWFLRAEELAPSAVAPKLFLGVVMSKLGDRSAALTRLHEALELNPKNVETLSQLARIYELQREYDHAENYARRALEIDPGNLMALTAMGRVDLYKGDPESAASRIEANLKIDGGKPAEVDFVMGTLGEAREKLGLYKDAYDAFDLGARYHRDRIAEAYEEHDSAFSYKGVQRLRAYFEDFGVGVIAEKPDDLPSPAFLVGFPRSGTTLLEQILSAHPDIETSDEKPNLKEAFQDAGTSMESLDRFMALSNEEISAIRQDYWRRARPEGPPEPGKLFVEKLPLTMTRLGLVAKIFPEARILFALRDPRDCVLSVFKQRFQMNAAMYRMLLLDTAADYYDTTMGAAVAARRAFPMQKVLNVRYEDTVADLEKQARKVIDFLEMEWTPEVLEYRNKLKKKTISTPSARQVVKPIYTSSIGMWRNYDFAMAQVRPILDPWAEYWGYDVD